jgi:hypothetical protein
MDMLLCLPFYFEIDTTLTTVKADSLNTLQYAITSKYQFYLILISVYVCAFIRYEKTVMYMYMLTILK